MRTRGIWALLLLLLFGSGCCNMLFPDGIGTKEDQLSSENGNYTFDAQTVLQSLAAGQKDVFTPQVVTPAPWWTAAPPAQWRQADFFRTAQAFSEAIWQEPIESWQLHLIGFRVQCVDAEDGPQAVDIRLFRSVPARQATSRRERYLYIEPQQGQIHFWGVEKYPDRFRWQAMDLARIRITAEQALQIAETWGGHLERWKVEDRCNISGILMAGQRDNDWRITYYADIGPRLFEIQVDEQTGKTKITYPQYK